LSNTHEGFSDVDQTGDAGSFVAYLGAADALPAAAGTDRVERLRAAIMDRSALFASLPVFIASAVRS
jgi:hypothetical protein